MQDHKKAAIISILAGTNAAGGDLVCEAWLLIRVLPHTRTSCLSMEVLVLFYLSHNLMFAFEGKSSLNIVEVNRL